jgi:ADP-heptose:LPS heptosyltransferase
MPADRWEALVKRLSADGIFVAQAGGRRDRYIRGAYSLLGVTTVREAIALTARFDLVVTTDNLFVHAARLVNTPAVTLWGATGPETYGWPGQARVIGHRICQHPDGCLARTRGGIYATPCPMGPNHCMNTIGVESILTAVQAALGTSRTKRPARATGKKP